MPALAPDAAIAAVLAADLSLALVSGTSLFCGPMPDGGPNARPSIPDLCVAVMITGGGQNEPYVDGGAGAELCRTTVQVFVRGDRDAFEAGQAKARAIRNSLNFATVTDYIGCDIRESEPTWLGFDETRRPLWTMNAELLWKN
jgi:hypothetical protein